MNAGTSETMDELVNEWTDGWMDESMHGWII